MGRDGAGRRRQIETRTRTYPERWARTLALSVSIIFIMVSLFISIYDSVQRTIIQTCRFIIQFVLCTNLILFHSSE